MPTYPTNVDVADITAAKKIEAELREQHRHMTKQATAQGLALDKALEKSKPAPKRKSKP